MTSTKAATFHHFVATAKSMHLIAWSCLSQSELQDILAPVAPKTPCSKAVPLRCGEASPFSACPWHLLERTAATHSNTAELPYINQSLQQRRERSLTSCPTSVYSVQFQEDRTAVTINPSTAFRAFPCARGPRPAGNMPGIAFKQVLPQSIFKQLHPGCIQSTTRKCFKCLSGFAGSCHISAWSSQRIHLKLPLHLQ